MSKQQASKFTKQLGAFVQNHSPATPETWIGTIIGCSSNYTRCDIRLPDRGQMLDVPCFGVPKIGTDAILIFLNSSYSTPLALCNPMNVLDKEKVDIIKSRGAKNYHSNGDFHKSGEGYTGNGWYLDDSVISGKIPVSVSYKDNVLKKPKEKSLIKSDDNSNIQIAIESRKKNNYGIIPITVTLQNTDGTPIEKEEFSTSIFGDENTWTSEEGGVTTINYYPTEPFTREGYMAVLPKKDTTLEFDCTFPKDERNDDFFKVQCYYKSRGSVLRLEVLDKRTNKPIGNVPYATSTDYQLWNTDKNMWYVNRETYPRDDYETIHVKFTNVGDEPIWIDGILVHDESSNYDFYKSKEDLIDA